MGKRTGGLLCVLLLALLPAGCQFIRIEEGERTPLEYTIVKQEEIPEEISELMEQKKKNKRFPYSKDRHAIQPLWSKCLIEQ